MKLSVSIYSFAKLINSGELNAFECIEKAKEIGFDAIEIVDFVFGSKDKKEFAKQLRNKADEVGISISNLAVGANLLEEGAVCKLKEWVDIAEILDVKFMRHDVCYETGLEQYEGYDNILPRLADACREVTEYAETKGIKTMTENHGFFSQDSTRVEKLINTVAHKNFGQLVDFGNFLCADEDPVTAVGRNAKYAFYIHAKDFIVKSGNGVSPGDGFITTRGGNFIRGTIIGHGEVPVLQCMRAMKRVGFDGWLALEFEGMEDCLKGIELGFTNLKNYLTLI